MHDDHAAPDAATEALELEAAPVSVGVRLVNLTAVVLPFAGLFGAMVLMWERSFHWIDLALLVGMYVLTVVGIGVGFHRLFTHHAFETYHTVQFALAAIGSMAVQGPLLRWVALHRRHHQHSDQHGDPHSPVVYGRSIRELIGGFWHAHLGWLFLPDAQRLGHYVKDLDRSRLLRAASSLFPLWVAVGLLIPALIAGAVTGTWIGAFRGFLWGGLVRVLLVHHVTWSINSVCHLWGRQPFRSGDNSRDNFIFGVLALGEGWHNSHHAFPTSARHGLRWWQLDGSYWVIRTLELLGLAWNVRVPSLDAQSGRR